MESTSQIDKFSVVLVKSVAGKCDGKGPPLCDCDSCEAVWNVRVPEEDATCLELILSSMYDEGWSELRACNGISLRHREQCFPCAPADCDGQNGPTRCGCADCTDEIQNAVVGQGPDTFRERVTLLIEQGALWNVACSRAATEFNVPQCHPNLCDGQVTTSAVAARHLMSSGNVWLVACVTWVILQAR